METRQMTSFFHLLFRLQLFVTFIFVFENNQNLFSCGPPFVSFLVCKISQIWAIATNSDSPSYFSKK